mmetsp:Transcript_54045/g.94289  ORF Transcript_54045/g.94289 Transcript_54045/m.94289 type:complete len:127 (-) Transcript_54045:7-387(-)
MLGTMVPKNGTRLDAIAGFQDLLTKLSLQFHAQVNANQLLQQEILQLQRRQVQQSQPCPLPPHTEEELADEANAGILLEEVTQDFDFSRDVGHFSKDLGHFSKDITDFSKGSSNRSGTIRHWRTPC